MMLSTSDLFLPFSVENRFEYFQFFSKDPTNEWPNSFSPKSLKNVKCGEKIEEQKITASNFYLSPSIVMTVELFNSFTNI